MENQTRNQANRKHKDLLFTLVFQDKKDLLDLYNAVNGTDYKDPEELEITTLEQALYLGIKNDASFVIGATMNLYEHQSTLNPNMPLRGLSYFATLYDAYVTRCGYSIYRDLQIPLPYPNYLVFYNGTKWDADRMELSLSDAFQIPEHLKEQTASSSVYSIHPALECRATVLNINRGHNQELMERCQRLQEYSEFIYRLRQHLAQKLPLGDAIELAMNECIQDGILVDILARCRTEVRSMLCEEYDEKTIQKLIRNGGYADGYDAGYGNGFDNGFEQGQFLTLISLVRGKFTKGISPEDCASMLESDLELTCQIYEIVRKHPDWDNKDIYTEWKKTH
jgi:hypothetical protein